MAQHALPSHKPFPWLENLSSALVLVGVFYCAIHLARYGYLPIPFFYEPSDAFADWFNTAYWARQTGAYDTWLTVYLPLSFVIMRIFGRDACYPEFRAFDASPGFDARHCDWIAYVFMGLVFLANIILTYKFFSKLDKTTASPRTICVTLGLPMLSCLERGNLLLLAYTCVLLAFSPFVYSTRLKWVLLGIAVNLKIYLIAIIFSVLLKRRWLWFEGGIFATLFIYLITLAAFGDGTPAQIYANITNFAENGAERLLDAWSASTYLPLISILSADTFPSILIIGSKSTNLLLSILPLMRYAAVVLLVTGALLVWISPEKFTLSRVGLLGVCTAFSVSETTLYTLMFVVLFVLMEPWKGVFRKWAILMCYLISVPLDYPVDTLPERVADLFFAGRLGIVLQDVGLGSFLRPFLFLNIAWAIGVLTIIEGLKPFFEKQGSQFEGSSEAS